MPAVAKAFHDSISIEGLFKPGLGSAGRRQRGRDTILLGLGRSLRSTGRDARRWVLETPPSAVPRRLPRLATAAFLIAAGVYGATLGGHWQTTAHWLGAQTASTASALGFDIKAVSFEGLAELEEADLLPIILMAQGLGDGPLDVAAIKSALLGDPWVAKAEVRRLFPNRLIVSIEEREPVALLQRDGLELVDAEGVSLGPLRGERYASLPVIAGQGAMSATSELARLMRAAMWLPSKPRGAVRVGQRRWNLILQDGSMLRLPAEQGGHALARLRELDNSGAVLTSALLSGRPIVIDLRFSDHVAFSVMRTDQTNDGTEVAEDDIDGAGDLL